MPPVRLVCLSSVNCETDRTPANVPIPKRESVWAIAAFLAFYHEQNVSATNPVNLTHI